MKNLMLGILLMSSGAFAKEGGNGGFAFKCVNSIQLVDLMEVNHIPFLKERILIDSTEMSYEQH